MRFSKIKKLLLNKEIYFHVLFWIFYFASISAVWANNWFDRSLRPETVSQFAILLFPIFFYFNAFWLIPKYLKQRKWLQYIFITSLIIFAIECFRILLYLNVNGINESFNSAFINEFNSYDNIILGRLHPIFLCLQFSFIYRFTRDWILNNSMVDSLKEDLKLTLLFWLFFSPFIIFTAALDDYISNIVFIISGIILISIDVFFVAYILLPRFLFKKHYFLFFISFILTQCFITFLQHSTLGENGQFTFTMDFLVKFAAATIENIKIMSILLVLLVSRKYYSSQNKVLKFQKEKNESELKWLKSQVNPHFLFNNLNALDDLIDRNPKHAKEYLHKLSNMYRYILTTAEKDVVSLQEEWDFIEDYTYLLKERYGKSYQFNKKNEFVDLREYLIPPATLQSLIENAVKHNQGSIENPLIITIEINTDIISISHIKRLKIGITNSLGTGIKNLKSRYKLLSNKEILIKDNESFSVTLPLIKIV